MTTERPEEINKVLIALIRRFGRGLEWDDCISEAWIAYMEAERSYHRYAGCCSWETYLSFRVQEALEELRRGRSRRIQLQSPFSLDQPLEENGTPAIQWFPSCQGSFENSLLFWDYVRRLDSPLREMAKNLAQGDSREEIMKEMNMDRAQYDFWRDTLRQELELSYLGNGRDGL